METYKSIKDYDNYEVSNMGNVRNKKTGLILKHSLQNGYYCVGLSTNGKSKNFRVHRLIALHFISNPDNKLFVDHINRIRTDNSINNLRWATPSENQMNKSVQKNNNSTKTGVYYDKHINRWLVKMYINGIQKHIGNYLNFEDAVIARKEQENIHHKEFQAFQNEIDRLEFEFQQAIK
jgi:hypothetical protein